jgi:hypothetical protein
MNHSSDFPTLPRPKQILPSLQGRKDAPRVRLASRGHIDCLDGGLVGEPGQPSFLSSPRMLTPL